MPSNAPVEVSVKDGVALMTLSRPDRLNAINREMRQCIRRHLAELSNSPETSAVVIIGAGKAFSAGQDLDEIANLKSDAAARWIRDLGELYGAIRQFPKPTVVAVNGIAAGAGLQMALHADLRIGCAESRFAQTEINVGLPSLLGPWVMNRTIGAAATLDMCLSARIVEAEEALRIGLLSRLVNADKLTTVAHESARSLGARPPLAIRSTKAWLANLDGQSFSSAVEAAGAVMAASFASGEPQRAISEFRERRNNA